MKLELENKSSEVDADKSSAQPQRLFHEYVKQKDARMLTQLLAEKRHLIDVNQPDWDGTGNASILDATLLDHVSIVQVLCENGSDANARTLRGETALHLAVSRPRLDERMVELLLANGCNADIRDNLGRQTALHMLAKKQATVAAAAELDDRLANVFRTLAQATDVNIADRRLRTPLHSLASSRKADPKLLRMLLERNADPNVQNERGETALHEALENDNEAAAEILAAAGTNLLAETKYKETPLHVAARKNQRKMVPLLLQHGAPVNRQDLYGNTALHLAASKGYNEVVRTLVENGDIQLNVSNKEGLTPLHLAVESGFIYTVEILLKADSCDLSARTKRCETALDLAQQEYRRRSQPEMTEVLSREIQRRSCGKTC